MAAAKAQAQAARVYKLLELHQRDQNAKKLKRQRLKERAKTKKGAEKAKKEAIQMSRAADRDFEQRQRQVEDVPRFLRCLPSRASGQ